MTLGIFRKLRNAGLLIAICGACALQAADIAWTYDKSKRVVEPPSSASVSIAHFFSLPLFVVTTTARENLDTRFVTVAESECGALDSYKRGLCIIVR